MVLPIMDNAKTSKAEIICSPIDLLLLGLLVEIAEETLQGIIPWTHSGAQ